MLKHFKELPFVEGLTLEFKIRNSNDAVRFVSIFGQKEVAKYFTFTTATQEQDDRGIQVSTVSKCFVFLISLQLLKLQEDSRSMVEVVIKPEYVDSFNRALGEVLRSIDAKLFPHTLIESYGDGVLFGFLSRDSDVLVYLNLRALMIEKKGVGVFRVDTKALKDMFEDSGKIVSFAIDSDFIVETDRGKVSIPANAIINLRMSELIGSVKADEKGLLLSWEVFKELMDIDSEYFVVSVDENGLLVKDQNGKEVMRVNDDRVMLYDEPVVFEVRKKDIEKVIDVLKAMDSLWLCGSGSRFILEDTRASRGVLFTTLD